MTTGDGLQAKAARLLELLGCVVVSMGDNDGQPAMLSAPGARDAGAIEAQRIAKALGQVGVTVSPATDETRAHGVTVEALTDGVTGESVVMVSGLTDAVVTQSVRVSALAENMAARGIQGTLYRAQIDAWVRGVDDEQHS